VDLGLARPETEVTGVALTLVLDTELTSKSCSGWETVGSGEAHGRASKLPQVE